MAKKTYLLIIPCVIQIFTAAMSFAAPIQDIDDIKNKGISSDQIISVWMGSGIGIYFSSDDTHSFLKQHVRNDPWSTFLGMSGKLCVDLTPVSWFNLELEGEAFTSVNISGSLLRKHAYHKLQGAVLPGIRFSVFDASYILAAGPAYSFHYFKGYQGQGLSYRGKLIMLPYVNDLSPFATTRGFIIYDYCYADDNDKNFELGGWGIQIGAEFHVL